MVRIGNVQMREFLGGVCPHQCTRGGGSSQEWLPPCVRRVSHSHSLPLWETLQGKQSLLKFGLSLGFTPLFHLDLILGLEHLAYAGVNLLVAGQTFAWFPQAVLPNVRNGNTHRLQMLLPAVLLNDSPSLTFSCVWRGWIYSVYLWWPQSLLLCVFWKLWRTRFNMCLLTLYMFLGFCFHNFVLFIILLSIFFETNYWKIVFYLLLFFIWSIVSIFFFP